MKMLKITLEGKTYEVGVEVIDAAAPVAAAPAPVQSAAAAPAAPVAAPAPAASGAGSVASPMAGLVMKIRVAVGQQVAKDQEIMVLEAMKMESPIFAPAAGTIAAILVKEGDAVTEGQVMIQMN
jgi:glutaconyl-CoA/methylmalonyl-CoA decarboxylase subunit gamma